MKITNSNAGYWIVCFSVATAATAFAAPLNEARVSQVIQDVRMLPSNASPRPAAVNDKVTQGTAVRTGTQSRAELTFQDLTITRLGENTVFSLKEGTRDVNLKQGSILLQVPSGAPTATIRTAAVTAAVSGGTAMYGMGPPQKFMVLEGVGTFYPAGHPEQAVTVHGGEMITLGPNGQVQVSTFDVKVVMATSPLITQFEDLANLPLILDVQNSQPTESNPGQSPPPSKDIIDTTSTSTTANPTVNQSPPPTSGPTPPSETGPPPTITTPDPYVISSGTTIRTDPMIITGTKTDNGTFYRGTALDGTPTEFLFGETETSFDQMVFNNADKHLPIAVFKFSDLELTGNPTVIIPSGATTFLALVSVGPITSGGPGGVLTFTGITRLNFITQNGSINLGSEISFSGIDHLEFYARGTGSNLTLASSISGGSVVHLDSEGSTTVNGNISVSDQFSSLTGQDFLAGGGTITATNVDILALNNINFNLSQFANPADNSGEMTLNALNTLNVNLDRSGGFGWSTMDWSAETININGANPFDFSNVSGDVILAAGNGGINAAGVQFLGHNLTLTSLGDITIGSAITPLDDSDNHFLDGAISAGGSFTASGSVYTGTLSAETSINVGGSLNTGGDITLGGALQSGLSLVIGGSLNGGGSLSEYLDNSGGSINDNVSVLATVGGGLNTQGDATFELDNSEGGQIAGSAEINISALALGVGGSLTAFINNRDGGSIDGSAQVSIDLSGALTTGGDATIGISNRNDGAGGGTINGDATVNVQANSISIGGFLTAFMSANGGVVSGNASLTFNVSGDITSGTGTEFDLHSNAFNGSGGPLTPGVISGNATLSVTATNLTSNGYIYTDISNNGGGTISGNATLTLNLSGDINAQQEITAVIADTGFSPNGGVGSPSQINGNATVTLQAQNIITASTDTGTPGIDPMALEASIYTNVNGSVGGDAIVNVSAAQQISAPGDTLFLIGNGNYQGLGLGTIGGNAEVNVSATDISTGNFYFQIENYGGSQIGESAALNLNASNSMTVNGALNAVLDNFNGGQIGGDASVQISVGTSDAASLAPAAGTTNNLTANSVFLGINNSAGGEIGGVAIASLNVTGDLSAGGITLSIANQGGAIGSDAGLALSANNINSTGALVEVLANNGGTINGGAAVNLSANSLTTGASDLNVAIDNTGGEIAGPASVTVFTSGDINATGNSFFQIVNNGASANIGNDAVVDVQTTNFSTTNQLVAEIGNQSGIIDGNAAVIFNATGNVSAVNSYFQILNGAGDSGFGGSIDGSASIDLTAQSINLSSLTANIDNTAFGTIGGSATIQVGTTGVVTGAPLPSGPGDLNAGSVFIQINNTSGSINGDATTSLDVFGNATVSGVLQMSIENYDFVSTDVGAISGAANISLTTGGDLSAASVFEIINNGGGGYIGSGASLSINVGGALTTSTDSTDPFQGSESLLLAIITRVDPAVGAASSIGGDATINVSADSASIGGTLFAFISNHGSTINGSASAEFDITNSMTVQGDATIQILNQANSSFPNGGTINGNATITLNLQGDLNVNGSGSNSGALGAASFTIFNNNAATATGSGGSIFGNALITINAANITAASDFAAEVNNQLADFGVGPSGGSIDGDAKVLITATSLTVGGELDAFVSNRNNGTNGSGDRSGGTITGNAEVNVNLSGDLTATGLGSDQPPSVPGDANFDIFNENLTSGTGGLIDGNATVSVSAANISTSGMFDAEIDNELGAGDSGSGGTINGNATITVATRRDNFNGGSPGDLTADSLNVAINNVGGSISGNETINMNVGGTATTTGDATFAITGNDPTGEGSTASINFNGGTYNVGGNFRSTIDGNGTIKFNSVDIQQANTIKVGAGIINPGSNGILMIGGGSMTANQLLRLYATGSNGSIEFTASIHLTLNSATTAIILAANKITIDQNVVVTILGSFPASVYANIANYAGGTCGNNCGSYGSFGGNGATTSAFGGQPGFDDPPGAPTANKATAATASTKATGSSSTTVASAATDSSAKIQKPSGTSVASVRGGGGASLRGHRSSLTDGVKQSAHNVASTNTSATTNNTIKVADSGQLLSVLDSATPSSSGKIMITSSKGDGVAKNPSSSGPNRPDAAPGVSHDRSTRPTRDTTSTTPVALLDHAHPSVR